MCLYLSPLWLNEHIQFLVYQCNPAVTSVSFSLSVQKEEERLRASIRRESQQRRMREKQHQRGLNAGYLEPDRYDEDEEGDESISLAAIKSKYKGGGLRGRWWRAKYYTLGVVYKMLKHFQIVHCKKCQTSPTLHFSIGLITFLWIEFDQLCQQSVNMGSIRNMLSQWKNLVYYTVLLVQSYILNCRSNFISHWPKRKKIWKT